MNVRQLSWLDTAMTASARLGGQSRRGGRRLEDEALAGRKAGRYQLIEGSLVAPDGDGHPGVSQPSQPVQCRTAGQRRG